jgi:hypothetical protein
VSKSNISTFRSMLPAGCLGWSCEACCIQQWCPPQSQCCQVLDISRLHCGTGDESANVDRHDIDHHVLWEVQWYRSTVTYCSAARLFIHLLNETGFVACSVLPTKIRHQYPVNRCTECVYGSSRTGIFCSLFSSVSKCGHVHCASTYLVSHDLLNAPEMWHIW